MLSTRHSGPNLSHPSKALYPSHSYMKQRLSGSTRIPFPHYRKATAASATTTLSPHNPLHSPSPPSYPAPTTLWVRILIPSPTTSSALPNLTTRPPPTPPLPTYPNINIRPQLISFHPATTRSRCLATRPTTRAAPAPLPNHWYKAPSRPPPPTNRPTNPQRDSSGLQKRLPVREAWTAPQR